jgi:diguanylate cyclase (GGDEF)-like protein/PAS domain S-box-containing protein
MVEQAEGRVGVMVADAEPGNHSSLMAALREIYGHSVDVVPFFTATAAVDALLGRQFDIVFVNTNLPDDGAAEILGVSSAVAPKTLFVAVDDEDGGVDQAIVESGASDFISMIGLTAQSLRRSILYAEARKRADASLRESKDRMIHDLINVRSAKARAEAQSTAYLRAAEELAQAKQKLEEALHQAEENERRYRILADNSPVGIWNMDQGGATVYVNDAMRQILEIGATDDVGALRYDDLLFAEDVRTVGNAVVAWRKGDKQDVEARFIGRRSGRVRYVVMSGVNLPSSGHVAQGVLVTAVEITERKEVESAIQHMAHHDALTGLPNRTLFWERIQQALLNGARQKTELAVMFLDLDRFKDVNDTLGHPVGDKLLIEVSERLLACVRESDTVARLGGDEFAILCTNLEQAQNIRYLAQRIVESIARPCHIDGHEIHTATSIGISLYPSDAEDADKLIRYADMALYTSKEAGRSNYHFFDRRMDEEVQQRKNLEVDLRDGVERGDFVLHFQPQIDLRSGAVAGAEALVRWRHPVRGLVGPREFVPIAEQCGLIVPIGQWVIRAALSQIKAWGETLASPLGVSVNLSGVQFKQKNFVRGVRALIEEIGVDPSLLEFEVTEGMLMANADLAGAVLRGLSEIGVRVSIDDFGTGFSSLAHLKRFPVDRLKIDRSFVADVLVERDAAVIASSIVKLAHSLGMEVVAEGVETAAQAEFLRQEGCDYAQGFHYAEPMAASDVAAALGLLP